MSFHGGLLGVAAGVIGFSLRNRLPILGVGDAVAAAAPIGLFFGRHRQLHQRRALGPALDRALGRRLPRRGGAGLPARTGPAPAPATPRSSTRPASRASLLFVLLALAIRAGALARPGRVFGLFLVGYALARIVVERFRQADAQFVTAATTRTATSSPRATGA